MHSLLHRLAMPQRVFTWAVAGLLLCALFATVALAVYQTDRNSRLNLKEQFRIRADIGEAFLRAYVQELLERERSMAELQLAEPQISDASFDALVHASGFKAAVVLDSSGKLMQVHPATPELHGSELASRYAHLRTALITGSAVSGVVPSAAESAPIVAFATRYDSSTGPRIFSGAFDVRATPLRAYMENLLELPGANADLMDESGTVLASSRQLTPHVNVLASIDPLLFEALRSERSDEYQSEAGGKLFFERKVSGTPWSLVISVEQGTLYAVLGGDRRWVQWMLFGGFCAVSVVAAWLLMRLRAVSTLHAHLARVDRLTALPNRLHLEEHMARLVSAATRHKRPFSIFIVDVDHFKSVNDSHGHRVGDEVLRVLAARMAAALRAEDMLGRWGGEEFLALLPNTSAEGACIVANRVRTMAGSSPIVTADGSVLHVTVSIGCATKVDPKDVDYIQRADEALYSAKTLGRDRVVSSAPPTALQDAEAQPLAQST